MAAASDEAAVRLRPMTHDDVPDVIAIEQGSYIEPWTEGIFHDCLRVGYICWVWEAHGRVVGYGVMAVGAGEAHILNLVVDRASRGGGLGRRMIEHLMTLARRHGAWAAYLEVRPSNGPALALYRALGFDEVGRRKDYYPTDAGREDALVLSRRL